ncbi:hypothetical protein TNCV_2072951 [Trichonephila clavipes]|nr:hypothetical protein TNCV_2072951 [Trichonephila clavipes]
MMSSRRFRKSYRQLNDFERGRTVGMREAGWSSNRSSPAKYRHNCSKMLVAMIGVRATLTVSLSTIQRTTTPSRPLTTVVPSTFLRCLERSSDLSPIEHVWDMVERQIRAPQNIADLEQQLVNAWQNVS